MPDTLPTLEQVLTECMDWLLTAVTTEEASSLLSIPVATLETWRSRKSDGPCFVRIRNTRIIRYIRIELYRWLLSDGLLEHNGATGIPVSLPIGKRMGSSAAPAFSSSDSPGQTAVPQSITSQSGTGKQPPPPSRKRPSNSPRSRYPQGGTST